MKRASLWAVNPVLPSKDVSAAVKFYVTRLGFSLQFQDSVEAPHYAGLRRDNVELHVQWHDPVEWHVVERPMLRFVTSNIQCLFEEYRKSGVFHEDTRLRETVWGTQEFAFFDPDQNGLTFYCNLEDT